MRRIRLIFAPSLVVMVAFVLTLGSPLTASAQNVPPGVSGANQYTETLPGPGGNSQAGGGGGGAGGNGATGGGKSPSQALGAANARKLEALGPEGAAAAQLATESAPANAKQGNTKDKKPGAKAGHGAGSKSSPAKGSTDKPQGSSGVQQVLSQITGTGGSDSAGMDWLLPLLIGASVILAAAYVFARNRPARPQD
jgi:hypothetical protein